MRTSMQARTHELTTSHALSGSRTAYLSPREFASRTASVAPSLPADSIFSQNDISRTTTTSPELRGDQSLRRGPEHTSLPGPSRIPVHLETTNEDEKSASLPVIPGLTSTEQNDFQPVPEQFGILNNELPAAVRADTQRSISFPHDQPDLQPNLRTMLQRHIPVESIRDELLLLRSHFDQERNAAQAAQHFYEESHRDFMDLLSDSMQRQGLEADFARIDSSYQQLQHDSHVQKAQLSDLRRIERSISSLEFNLAEAEKEFMAATQKTFDLLPPLPEPTPEDFEPGEDCFIPPDRPDTPEPLQDYWDAIGSLEVLQHDLIEMDQEYQYDKANLERKLEQEFSVEKDIEEHERLHEHQRELMDRKIHAAEQFVQQLREACINQEIDPDIPRKDPSESSSEPVDPAPPITVFATPERNLNVPPPLTEPVMKSEAPLSQFEVLHVSKSSGDLPLEHQYGISARLENWLLDPIEPGPVDELPTYSDDMEQAPQRSPISKPG